MEAKAQLHFHTWKDPKDIFIRYSPYEAIDLAKEKWFKILSFTHHQKFVFSNKWQDYALKNWIILIPWIEIEIRKKHIIVLNADKDINKIKKYKDLEKYKKEKKDVFILAPHPFYPMRNCLRKNLYKYHYLFDWIEYCPFYSEKWQNQANLKADNFASKYNKNLIGTSDVHYLKHIEKTYSKIKIDFDIKNLKKEEISFYIKNIIENLKKNNINIYTNPFKKGELILHHLWIVKWKLTKPFIKSMRILKSKYLL